MSDRLALPTEYTCWHPCPGATVQFKCSRDAKGKVRPKFEVQVIDQYGYQREWTIEQTHSTLGLEGKPPNSLDRLYWVSHIYRHPGRRCIQEMTENVARRLMERFHYLVVNYPSLLFNEGEMQDGPTPRWRPVAEGFVHFSETLLDGAKPSVKVLG